MVARTRLNVTLYVHCRIISVYYDAISSCIHSSEDRIMLNYKFENFLNQAVMA